MAQPRSPGYPSMSLREAVEVVGKLYGAVRTTITDREAAAKDLGYSGLSGSSAKALADLVHFGLLERAGKGGIRVSERAVQLLWGEPRDKRIATEEAAGSPSLFTDLQEQFGEVIPSENQLKGYLHRRGFADVAIPYVTKSYSDTMRFVQEAIASESHGATGRSDSNEGQDGRQGDGRGDAGEKPDAQREGGQRRQRQEVQLIEDERVIFVDEAGPGQYLKVIATGELDDVQIEALEDFIKRRKKRIFRMLSTPGVETAKDELDGL